MKVNTIDGPTRQHAQGLLDFIDASPSPWQAVASVEKALIEHGFEKLDETRHWSVDSGGRYYVVRDGSSILFFIVGQKPLAEAGFRVVGAHTDSPGLRVKPNGPHRLDGMARIGVEVYGGPILATFTDRDLSLAGRVSLRGDAGSVETRSFNFDRPLLRLPNLAIHMNREVNQTGLKLDSQKQLPLIMAVIDERLQSRDLFLSLLAEKLDCEPEAIMAWDLNVYDTQKGAFFGPDQEFISDSQLDNLASCHAALSALLDNPSTIADSTGVCAFFDHEEIGSESAKGANGSFLADVLERVAFSLEEDSQAYKRALAHSFLISADMAHAYQPNFPEAYEPDHKVIVNQGPVIKLNANQRYTSEAVSEALFMGLCEAAEVPCQKYTHRTDIPCGSTIGPMTAARLGIRSVDVGNPMWAMHSIRESGGALDHSYMTSVLRRFFWDSPW